MSYDNNVPQGSQRIADTQPLIQGNFAYLDTAMKINHAWNGNEIAAEADGSHQKLSMPNQGADITGALPTGIAAIMYAIGGNLFTWNGTKNPVSGYSGNGTITTLNATPQTIITAPVPCIGFIIYQYQGATNGVIPFCVIDSTPTTFQYLINNGSTNSNSITVRSQFSGLDLQMFTNSGSGGLKFKYIYWPI